MLLTSAPRGFQNKSTEALIGRFLPRARRLSAQTTKAGPLPSLNIRHFSEKRGNSSARERRASRWSFCCELCRLRL